MIRQLARRIDQRGVPCTGTWADPKRKLHLAQYLGLFLFTLFNPVVRTVRGVCAASQLAKVQTCITGAKVSLGSFSEAQHLVDPQLLEGLIEELSSTLGGPPPSSPTQNWERWLAQDSSVFMALPRMSWAVYGGGTARAGKGPQHAVRLHLSFNVLRDLPRAAKVTHGKVCERQAWREQWEPGAAYVGDRNYSSDYQLLRQLHEHGCRYIVRLRKSAAIEVVEELPVLEEDRQAGVQRQALVYLGSRSWRMKEIVRVVWVETATAGTIILVTNLIAEEMSAALVAQMYRRRWQIEGFFRWVKCLLGCRHWLAESEEGVTLQLYLAIIGALLLQLATGERPNKRMMELLQLYQLGWASKEEVLERLPKNKVGSKS